MENLLKQIVEDYILAYNAFDIEGMIENMHDDVLFENISNDEVDLSTSGLEEFKIQAEKAKQYFSSRVQTIESWDFEDDKVTIGINYEGILAIDLPNGAMTGDTLALNGQSEFLFQNGKIISIKDRS